MKYSVHNFEPSEAENKIMDILNELEIEFLKDVKYENLGLYFDFLLPEYNILIEYNGKQHYDPYHEYHHGDYRSFEIQVYNDERKKEFCKLHGIKYLVYNSKDWFNLEDIIWKDISRYYYNPKKFTERKKDWFEKQPDYKYNRR